MIKLIAIDIDGTLIDKDHGVSDENIKAIRYAEEKGVLVTLCTGRMFSSVYDIALLLKLNAPVIFMNGALIKNPVTGEVFKNLTIGEDKIPEILRVLEKYRVLPNFYTEYDLFIGKNADRYRKFFMSSALDERYTMKEFTGKEMNDLVMENRKKINKFILFPGRENFKEIKEELQEIEGLEVVSSSSSNIEITEKGATKGNAVKELAEKMNIEDDEVMVIGDSENDLSMIRAFKNSVAMGNAPEHIKEAASYVAPDHCNSGVADAIRKMVTGF